MSTRCVLRDLIPAAIVLRTGRPLVFTVGILTSACLLSVGTGGNAYGRRAGFLLGFSTVISPFHFLTSKLRYRCGML